MLPLLYVGVLLSLVASPACINPPCKDNLVASPIQPGTGAAGTGACEGQTGTTACGTGVSLAAISDIPQKVEHKHEIRQFQYKVTDILYSTFHCVCVCLCFFTVPSLKILKSQRGQKQLLNSQLTPAAWETLKFTFLLIVL